MAASEFVVMLFALGFDGEWPLELALGMFMAMIIFMFSVKVYHDRKDKNSEIK